MVHCPYTGIVLSKRRHVGVEYNPFSDQYLTMLWYDQDSWDTFNCISDVRISSDMIADYRVIVDEMNHHVCVFECDQWRKNVQECKNRLANQRR